MGDYSEDPFQMDEDLPSFQDESNTPSSINSNNNDKFNYDSNYERNQENNDITPRFTDPNIIEDPVILYNDDKLIRSKLSDFKLNNDVTKETEKELPPQVESINEPTYDEDIDDKYDNNDNEIAQDYKNFQQSNQESVILTPPENFAPVINKIYRSSFPQPNNFTFLKKLKLKSVLCLIPEEYPKIHEEFFRDEKIELFQLGMSGNKEPFVKIPHDLITEAIKIVLNPKNQPILIHCNRGKHRTGCLVGVLRRLQQWSLTIIFDEYRKFAAPKERPMDQQFIELYDETELIEYAQKNELLPLKWN